MGVGRHLATTADDGSTGSVDPFESLLVCSRLGKGCHRQDGDVVLKLQRHPGPFRAGKKMIEDPHGLKSKTEILSGCTMLGWFNFGIHGMRPLQ